MIIFQEKIRNIVVPFIAQGISLYITVYEYNEYEKLLQRTEMGSRDLQIRQACL